MMFTARRKFRPSSFRCVSTSGTLNLGLLQGVKDIKTAKYYSHNMNLEQAAIMLRDKNHVYNAALKDCEVLKVNITEYLLNCKKRALAFSKSNEIWDREELLTALSPVTQETGMFMCLLGGKNTGKSFVLKSMMNANHSKSPVLYVDLRQHGSNVENGVYEELQKLSKELNAIESNIVSFVRSPTTAAIIDAGVSIWASMPTSIAKSIQQYLDDNPSKRFFNLLTTIAQQSNGLTIIVDEANLAFDVSKDTDIEQAKKLLATLTKLTKQDRLINVIFSTSEHLFPYRLNQLGFRAGNFTKLIFAGEIPPCHMYELLTTHWGFGSNLATAFINMYGGHIFDAYNAISELQLQKESYLQKSPWDASRGSSDVQYCSQMPGESDADRERMLKVLTSLAETGFSLHSLVEEDKVAQMVSARNVGGVVSLNSTIVGLPRDVLNISGKEDAGLVPAKQSMRLIIANCLVP